jgi:Holliday junction resolvasome RuvABC endonuclease subunit
MSAPYRSLTLAVHPSTQGFGWIAFEGPFSPYDWGVTYARGREKNAICLRRVEKLIERLTPETLVLEAFEEGSSKRRTRIANLGRAMVALAIDRGVEVAVYSFNDVRSCFTHLGARSRWEIAEAIARQQGAFAHLLPKKRRSWETESGRLTLFCAAALALTHYQRDARSLLEHLSS